MQIVLLCFQSRAHNQHMKADNAHNKQVRGQIALACRPPPPPVCSRGPRIITVESARVEQPVPVMVVTQTPAVDTYTVNVSRK